MSISEASERSGVPEDRIRMYEEGERQPYAKTLRRLAQTYGVSARELSGGAVTDRTAGARSLGARPRPRRRRRRVRSDEGADAHASVEVPIEVEQDQTIRVIIELIIRPKAPVHATGTGPVESRGPAGQSPEESRSVQGPRLMPGSDGDGTDNRPSARHSEPRRAGPNGGRDPGEPRDPLDDFRRAYSQFRRTRK